MDFASELAAKLGGAPVPKPASRPIDSGDEGSDEWGEEPAPKPPPISKWIFYTVTVVVCQFLLIVLRMRL